MLPCFKNMKAARPFKNYLKERCRHHLYLGLEIKIHQLHSLTNSSSGWFPLRVILSPVGQGVSSGLHTRILTERTNGCKRVMLKDGCSHMGTLNHCASKRILLQHSQIFQVPARDESLRSAASHQGSWVSAQLSEPSAGLDKCYYWTKTSLLPTPASP